MARKEFSKSFRGFYGPWTSPYDDSFEEEEHDWPAYLRRNLTHHAGKDSPFPDSSWSYARGDNTFADAGEGYYGKGPKGWKRSDDKIQEEVSEALYRSSVVDASDIEVFIANGVITLSGTVDSREAKKEAERLSEEVTGVWDVHNELKIVRPIVKSYS